MQSVLEKLVANLVIAAFLPSFVFATIILLFFFPILPATFLTKLDQLATRPIILLGIALIVGTLLLYMREIIYNAYRGRFFPKDFSYFEKQQAQRILKKISETQEKLDRVKQEIDALDKKRGVSKAKIEIQRAQKIKDHENLYFEVRSDIKKYQSNFAPLEVILPTRFGNILSAAEAYPAIRYGIDAPFIWPRLSQVIPEKDNQKIDDANHQLSFLVLSSFLSFITALLCAVVGLYQLFLWRQTLQPFFLYYIPGLLPKLNSQIYPGTGIAYLIGFLFFLFQFLMFYRAALPLARSYATKYCMAFDLYRFLLLEQFHLALPINNGDNEDIEERFLWPKICEFITLGDPDRAIYFEYTHLHQNRSE